MTSERRASRTKPRTAPRAPIEFASKNDYQLNQATNLLKAWQIIKR
jgi:hypothetical protein